MKRYGRTAGAVTALTCFCASVAVAQSPRAADRPAVEPQRAVLSTALGVGDRLAAPVPAGNLPASAERATVPVAMIAPPAAPYRAGASRAWLATIGDAALQQDRDARRLREYVHDIVGPGAIVGTVVAAVFLQATNDPSEWGGGWSGLWRRGASTEGQIVAQETLRYWTAISLDRSTRYQRCNCTGFEPRVRHAFVETFTDRDAAGRRAFSYPRVIGAFGGSAVRMVWWPNPTVGRTAAGGGFSLLFTFVGNVMSEYTHFPH